MATEKSSLEIEVKTKGVNKTTKELDKLAKSTNSADVNTENATQSSKQYARALDKQAKAIGGALNKQERANRSAGNLGQKAGLASIQIEQLVGQIAGGQNPMRAFGQQSADIGFVLGVPLVGAILGVSAALASLLPKLFNMGSSLEELTELSSELGSTFILSANGAAIYADAFIELQSQLAGVARLQKEVNLATAEKISIDGLKQLIKMNRRYNAVLIENTREQEKLKETGLDSDTKVQEVRINDLARSYNLSAVNLRKYIVTLQEVQRTGKGFDKLANRTAVLQQGTEALGKPNDKFRKHALQMLELLPTLAKAHRILNEANLEGRTEIEKRLTAEQNSLELGNKLITQLRLKLIAIKDGQSAADLADTKYHESQRETIANLNEEIRLAKQKATDDARANAEKLRLSETNKRIVQMLTQSTMTESEKILALHEKRQKAINDMEIKTEADRRLRSRLHVINRQETNKALAELADKAAKVETDNIAKVAKDKEAAQKASIALVQQALEQERLLFAESLTETQLYWTHWLETAQTTMHTFNGLGETMINSFQSSFATAIESAIFDSKSATQALQGMFEGIGRAFVRYTAQMIAQQMAVMAVNKILGASMADPMKKQFEKQKQFAKNQVYAAGINAYVQQLASLNSPTNALKAMILAMGITGSLASQMKGGGGGGIGGLLSSSGGSGGSGGGGGGGGGMMSKSGRALGGQVRGGESYIVGERGPEMLTMPSNRMGRITPNSSMSGGQLNVTVENYGSSNISVQKISETDVRIIAREVATQTVQREAPRVIASDISNPNGRVSKTLANNTNTQRRR